MPTAAALFVFSIGLVLAAGAAGAAPANKCMVDGTVTYQQGPCASGQGRERPTVEELNAREKKRRAQAASDPGKAAPAAPAASAAGMSGSFRCDGRRYCSQMTSCAEATYYLAHCPGVKMDGDRDGIPCEEQWCTR